MDTKEILLQKYRPDLLPQVQQKSQQSAQPLTKTVERVSVQKAMIPPISDYASVGDWFRAVAPMVAAWPTGLGECVLKDLLKKHYNR